MAKILFAGFGLKHSPILSLPKPLMECNFTLLRSFLVSVSDISLYICFQCVLFWQEIKN